MAHYDDDNIFGRIDAINGTVLLRRKDNEGPFATIELTHKEAKSAHDAIAELLGLHQLDVPQEPTPSTQETVEQWERRKARSDVAARLVGEILRASMRPGENGQLMLIAPDVAAKNAVLFADALAKELEVPHAQ